MPYVKIPILKKSKVPVTKHHRTNIPVLILIQINYWLSVSKLLQSIHPEEATDQFAIRISNKHLATHPNSTPNVAMHRPREALQAVPFLHLLAHLLHWHDQ